MLTEVIIKSSFRNNEKSSLFLIFFAMKARTYRNKNFLPGMQQEISINDLSHKVACNMWIEWSQHSKQDNIFVSLMQRSNKTQLAFFFPENLHKFYLAFNFPFIQWYFSFGPWLLLMLHLPSTTPWTLHHFSLLFIYLFTYLFIHPFLFIFRVKIEATGQSMPHNLFSA